ncbi:hypothetical protein GCM10011581_24950 [Saccharopolyspora subtropica]|uniref:Uncharacterized protein n=1 Tax=Saccharopolyspora thermophila TaxID=89367 RepID=A0A917JVD2_9PSEU|nr:hypothetical protein GCM10011581_24950 [Saccharopolyspora subtropica]
MGSGSALVIAVVVVVAVGFPAVAATVCLGCYGFVAVGPGAYAGSGLSEAQRQRVVDAVVAARQRVHEFYGGVVSSPRLLVCLDDDCYRRIGGGRERGVAVLNRAVLLSPRGVDPVIASHEMSHVELRHRLGAHADQVPQWFDEGLAVLVSGDPRYLHTGGDRCRVAPTGPLPGTLDEWLRAASADEQTYARAACRVSRWIDARGGGRAAVAELVARLTAGELFAAVVPD